ncbi:hypothetical protein BDB13_6149 [Rhodococcus sp. OK302]|nr:hypothetical protein BDB13_6149 [Rhodococcus sp. OK302]
MCVTRQAMKWATTLALRQTCEKRSWSSPAPGKTGRGRSTYEDAPHVKFRTRLHLSEVERTECRRRWFPSADTDGPVRMLAATSWSAAVMRVRGRAAPSQPDAESLGSYVGVCRKLQHRRDNNVMTNGVTIPVLNHMQRQRSPQLPMHIDERRGGQTDEELQHNDGRCNMRHTEDYR